MVDMLDVVIEGIVFVVILIIFIYAENTRRKQFIHHSKKAWLFLSAGFFFFVLTGLFDVLDEFDFKFEILSTFFDISGQIINVLALVIILLGLIHFYEYSSMFKIKDIKKLKRKEDDENF